MGIKCSNVTDGLQMRQKIYEQNVNNVNLIGHKFNIVLSVLNLLVEYQIYVNL